MTTGNTLESKLQLLGKKTTFGGTNRIVGMDRKWGEMAKKTSKASNKIYHSPLQAFLSQ